MAGKVFVLICPALSLANLKIWDQALHKAEEKQGVDRVRVVWAVAEEVEGLLIILGGGGCGEFHFTYHHCCFTLLDICLNLPPGRTGILPGRVHLGFQRGPGTFGGLWTTFRLGREN